MRLLSRPRVREVHLRPWPPEARCRCVVRAGGLVGGLEGSEPKTCIAGADLRVIHAGRAEAYTAIARAAPGAWRHGGAPEEARKKVRREGKSGGWRAPARDF